MAEDILELNELNFEEEVIDSENPVFVDFWADWCFPCKKLGPIYEEVAAAISSDEKGFEQLEEKKHPVRFAKVNIQENPQIIENLKQKDVIIMHIPHIVLFNKGGKVGSIEGLLDKDTLKAKMKELLKKVNY